MAMERMFHKVGKVLPEKVVRFISNSEAAETYRKLTSAYYTYRNKQKEKPQRESRVSEKSPPIPIKVYVGIDGLIYSEEDKPSAGVSELNLANLGPWEVTDWTIIDHGALEIIGIAKDEDPFTSFTDDKRREANRIWRANNIRIIESRDSKFIQKNSWGITDESHIAKEIEKNKPEKEWDPESGFFLKFFTQNETPQLFLLLWL